MSKIALIVKSDGHSGHREGHCSPDTELADDVPMKGRAGKHKVNLTGTQQAIHQVSLDALSYVKSNCKGYQKWYIDLGEVMQGNRYIDNLQTSDMHEQKMIATVARIVRDPDDAAVAHARGKHRENVCGGDRCRACAGRSIGPRRSYIDMSR